MKFYSSKRIVDTLFAINVELNYPVNNCSITKIHTYTRSRQRCTLLSPFVLQVPSDRERIYCHILGTIPDSVSEKKPNLLCPAQESNPRPLVRQSHLGPLDQQVDSKYDNLKLMQYYNNNDNVTPFYPRRGRQRCTLRDVMPLYNVHPLFTFCIIIQTYNYKSDVIGGELIAICNIFNNYPYLRIASNKCLVPSRLTLKRSEFIGDRQSRGVPLCASFEWKSGERRESTPGRKSDTSATKEPNNNLRKLVTSTVFMSVYHLAQSQECGESPYLDNTGTRVLGLFVIELVGYDDSR
ncbi:hypothetical protein SFRURICE_018663 [Spodoptera frugiperda]|nr:hypothetical protein SFRURICE_018663 [Spodoptera frugiperda]